MTVTHHSLHRSVPGHPVIGIADHVALGVTPPPLLDRVDVMQQFGELRITTSSCRLWYALERTAHVIDPARTRDMRAARAFPLARSLPSTASAATEASPTALFGSFFGTTPRSEFPRPWLIVYARRLHDARCGKALRAAAAGCGTSRFPCSVFPRVRGVSDRAGSMAASLKRQPLCGLRCISTTSAPRTYATEVAGHGLGGSIPGLRVPLSTLRRRPRGRQRMTRGRCSRLNLQR